jgi:hypothetical protein
VLLVQDEAIEARLVPFDGLLGLDLVLETNSLLGVASARDTVARAAHDTVEVHTVDTDGGIVLDTKIDVFLDTETEVTSGGEVASQKLIFLDLKTTFEDLQSLLTTDSDVDRDLFVTTDTEGTDSVASLGVDGSLTSKLFKHLSSTSESVTRFTNANVENKLLEAKLTHRVLSNSLIFGALRK